MRGYAIIYITVAIVLSSCNNTAQNTSVSSQQAFNLDTTVLKSGVAYYQCDMDPEILSDRNGDCPKCGMALTEHIKH